MNDTPAIHTGADASDQYRRRRHSTAPLRRTGLIGLLVTIPVVLVVVLWPTHFLLDFKPRIVHALEWAHTRGMFEFLYWTRLEVLANVAMFVPVALVLVFVLGARRWWIALAICIAATVGVELTQHFMPGRVASLKDIVANSAGAVIGVVLGALVEHLVRRSRRNAVVRP